jgi:hypothetical protein
MSKGKVIWAIIIIVIIVIQLIPSDRPEVIATNDSDLLKNVNVPDSVSRILKSACYDCHSNETKYPWYAYVAPVSWLVSRDARLGRANMNLSEWETLSKMDKASLLSDIADEVESGEMPMPIYVLMHPEAKLSAMERTLIVRWTDELGEKLFE